MMKRIIIIIGIILAVIILVWMILPKNKIIELKEGKEYVVFRQSMNDALGYQNILDEFFCYMESKGYRFIPDTDLVKGEMDFENAETGYELKDIMPHITQYVIEHLVRSRMFDHMVGAEYTNADD